MIFVLSFIINLLAPIVNSIGLCGLIFSIIEDDNHILTLSAILCAVGLIYGIFAYSFDVPPRWFWSESKNEIFEFAVTAVLGYAWNFAMWPCAIYMVSVVVDGI